MKLVDANILLYAVNEADQRHAATLAALALEHDAVVVTYDNDFGRFRGVSWERPAG